jgi:cobaltochelatase CobS
MAAPQIQKLEEIIATSTDPVTVEKAQQMLDLENRRLASIGSAQVQTAAMTGVGDADVVAVLEAIKSALKSSGTGTVNMADLRKAVNEELAIRKITEKDLSPSLLAWLNSSRKVNLTINKMLGVTLTKEVKASTLERPLVQLVLSDLMARNNVYLYGGAGTGKTYLAEQIAEMLGWTAITLNCNQFTSPLDILGGQTITGYQDGKVAMAWSNKLMNEDGTITEVDGCVLILDELPKIDPNTAGILNEALAKVKDFKYDEETKTYKKPTIRNGKNKVLPLENLFVIATGNVPLNTIDPDYEANFKQDLSLQDRFIGSTYKVFVDYEYEFNTIMNGFAFIWIFLVKVRKAIEKNRASGQAFVSLRLMINVKATYVAYREVLSNITLVKGSLNNQAISNPKTIVQSMETFFGLFKVTNREAIMNEVDFAGFKRIVEQKDTMPYDPAKPDFDTPEEIKEAQKIIEDYKATQTGI